MNPSRYNFTGAYRKSSMGSYFNDIATYEPERSMSNARLSSTILTLFMALSLAFCSLFYIPALFNMNITIGISTSRDDIRPLTPPYKTPWYAPAISFLHMKRGYFKAGSNINVAYNSTEGSKITLYYTQCSGIPIVEVFSCPRGPIHSYELGGHQGEARIPVHKSGFYHFSEEVKYLTNTGDYITIWSR